MRFLGRGLPVTALVVATLLAWAAPLVASSASGLVLNKAIYSSDRNDLYLGKVKRIDGALVFDFYFQGGERTKIDNIYVDRYRPVRVWGISIGRYFDPREDRHDFSVTLPDGAAALVLQGIGPDDRDRRLEIAPYAALLAEFEASTSEGGPTIELVALETDDGTIAVDEYLYEMRGFARSDAGIAKVTVNSRTASLGADGSFAKTLRLKVGPNPVRIDVVDTQGRTRNTVVTLVRQDQDEADDISDVEFLRPGKGQRPDDVAVVIGNRDYTNGTPKVEFAISDARTVREFVVTSLGFRPGNVIYVENATKTDLESLFGTTTDHRGRLFDFVREGESDVFVYYSGHGAPDVESRKGYLVPVDADPMRVRLAGYSLATLYENLAKIPARRMTVVLDACFSGAVQGGSLLRGIRPIMIQAGEAATLPGNATLFASSQGEEVSHWYAGKSHGLFTYFFLKGAQGAADADSDAKITNAELTAFLKEEVAYNARRLHGRDQNPRVVGPEHWILAEYEPAVDDKE